MKLYLAGPMRGYEQYNFPAFHAAAAELRAEGHEVVSPAEADLDAGFDPGRELKPHETTAWFMKRDLPLVLDCDGIALLPGWEDSTGARIEKWVAEACGLEVIHLDPTRREGHHSVAT